MSPTLNVTTPPHLQHEGSKVEGSMCWIADPAFPRCCTAACHLLGACQACGGCSPLPSGGRRGAADPPRAPPAAPRPHGHMEVGGAGGLLVSCLPPATRAHTPVHLRCYMLLSLRISLQM